MSANIESINPYLRNKLRPFTLKAAGGVDVTLHAMSMKHAKERFREMTAGEVAFIPANSKPKQKKVKH